MRFADQREDKMAKRGFLLIGIAGIFLFTVSCAGPSRVEMDYGTSFKLAKFNQTLNPQAEKNLEPVIGFDGSAAQAAVGRYRKGFEEKTSAPVYSINIGGDGNGDWIGVSETTIRNTVNSYLSSYLISLGNPAATVSIPDPVRTTNPDTGAYSPGGTLTVSVTYTYTFMVIPNFIASIINPITLAAQTVMRFE